MTKLYFIYTNVLDKKNFEGLAYLMSKFLLHIGFKKTLFCMAKKRPKKASLHTKKASATDVCVQYVEVF